MTSKLVIRQSALHQLAASSILISRMTSSSVTISYGRSQLAKQNSTEPRLVLAVCSFSPALNNYFKWLPLGKDHYKYVLENKFGSTSDSNILLFVVWVTR